MSAEPIVLRPWHSAEYLKTEKDMALYLDACLEEGAPALITHALGVIARVRGMPQIAHDMGASSEGRLEFATVMKVIEALGFRLHAESTGGCGSS